MLAAAAQAAGFDLVVAGDWGVVGAGGQLGVLAAAHLGVPCVTRVGTAALSPDAHRLTATRELERGFRETVEAALPVVVTVAAGAAAEAAPPPLTARALLAAREQDIPLWTLADLGVVPGAVRDADRPLEYGRPDAPASAPASRHSPRSDVARLRPNPGSRAGLGQAS